MAHAAKDKEGVVVSGREGVDFGILDAGTSVEVTVTIENTTEEYAFAVNSYRMRSSTRQDAHGKM